MYRFIRICLLITIIGLSYKLSAQNRLIINGTINKKFNKKTLALTAVYPYKSNLVNPKIDIEAVIKNGKFTFSVPANSLERYKISLVENEKESHYATFLLLPQPTEINFLDTLLKKYDVIGNKINKVYRDSIIPITDGRNYTTSEINTFVTSWIENHLTSPLNAYIINTSLLNKISDNKILSLFNLIPVANKKGSYYNELKFITENLYVGKKAPEFSQKDTSRINVSLSQFRGKYVLIDFWASWCVPCRAENPFLVVAKKEFDDKIFEIISISLDDNQKQWLEAIRKDGINWKHVSDLNGWNNEISKNYRIRSVPSNFLLDPNGIIIAKNLRGEEVLKILNTLIK